MLAIDQHNVPAQDRRSLIFKLAEQSGRRPLPAGDNEIGQLLANAASSPNATTSYLST
jgi:hypothetical protein